MKNYYQVLELPDYASAADIRRAYRRLVLITHPDRTTDPVAHSRYLVINEAYEVVSDPIKRQLYDARLAYYLNPPPPAPAVQQPPPVRMPPPVAWRRRAIVVVNYNHYAQQARRWCRVLLLLPFTVLLDYFVLLHSVKARVFAFYTGGYHASVGDISKGYFVKTTQGNFLTNKNYPEGTDQLVVQTSRLFHFVRAATLPNGRMLPITFGYYSWAFFVGLLTVVGLLGQWRRLPQGASINAAITATMLTIIVLAMLWRL